MRKLPACLLILSAVLFFAASRKDNCSVKYNGIYAYKIDAETSAVLRFYEDGTVLASSSVNDYFDVFSWFHKDNKDMVLTGTYKIKKCGIRFEVKGMAGEQKYEGVINDNSISVELKDGESKKTVSRVYTFFVL